MRVDPLTPERILAEARGWLGVPWRHQGRTRAGVDCAGLVVMVGRALGLTDYDTTGYSRRANGQAFVRHFQAAMDDIRLPEATLGDVLVFADHAYPCHCGFLTMKFGQPHLVHAHVTRRQVVEEPYAGEWPEKVKFAFRFRGPRRAKPVPGGAHERAHEKVHVPAGDGAGRQIIISGGVA